jgi:poly[(R)-3-hydroxyalkanoate] polymerase subunit PhaE
MGTRMAQSAKAATPNDWFDQTSKLMKSWNEQGQSFFQTWAEGLAKQGPANPSATGALPDSMQGPLSQMTEFFNKSMEQWGALAQWPKSGKSLDANALKKLFDPAEWGRAGIGGFDLALEHLTEGPTYANLWDLDRKLLKAQRLSQQRLRHIATYQAIVQDAWRSASERFLRALSDASRPTISSARELLDLWVATANETLIEMHRTPKFLEAQRNVTRSSADYRLQEREIAETFCEVHHIPTRGEVDELQRTVVELRRQVRALTAQSSPRSNAARVVRTPAKAAAPRARKGKR